MMNPVVSMVLAVGALSILVPEKLPVIDTVSNPEVQFTIKMVDFRTAVLRMIRVM